MRLYESEDHTRLYRMQMQVLSRIAQELGVVLYKPDYHRKSGDKNTVLFYTKDDSRHNHQVDREPTHYSASEAKDLARRLGHPVDDRYVYRDYFWWFENSDQNGQFNYEFANYGAIDLRDTSHWYETLYPVIRDALQTRLDRGNCEVTHEP